MTITHTMKTADSVLAKVKKMMPKKSRYSLQPYQNGREHGWALVSWESSYLYMVCFAEFRNSDAIVVYRGTVSDFSSAGNVPSDEVYDAKRFVSCTTPEVAAEMIIEWLEK